MLMILVQIVITLRATGLSHPFTLDCSIIRHHTAALKKMSDSLGLLASYDILAIRCNEQTSQSISDNLDRDMTYLISTQ